MRTTSCAGSHVGSYVGLALVSITLFSSVSAAAAPAAPTVPGEPLTGAITALEVHDAARFIGTIFRAQVVVVGGTADPVNVDLGGTTVETALTRLAAASGLQLGHKDAIWVLAPAELTSRIEGPRRPLPAGARVNLDLRLIEADELLRVLGEVLKLKVDGHVVGRLSLVGRNFGALTLTGLVTRLAGKEASRHDGKLLVGEALPDAPAAAPPMDCPPDGVQVVELRCVEPSAMEMAAWARRGEHGAAAIRARSAASDRPLIAFTETGHGLGKAGARVDQIDAGGVVLAGGGKVAPAQPAQDFSKVEVKVEKLTPQIAVLHGSGGNIGVSFGDDGVFLIDDQFAPLNAKIRAAVETLAKGAIRFVFNTHWHGDHTGGNLALANQGAVIVAHDNVLKRLSTDQFMSLFKRKTPASPPKALPVITFGSELTFHLNGDEASVFHVEHAHTDGDSIVWFKKANVVHMGDTFVVGGFPLIDVDSGGSLDGFIAAADRVLGIANDATIIIPGHGVTSDKKHLAEWRDMIVTIRKRVAKLKADHKTLEQAIAEHPTAEFDAGRAQGFIKPPLLIETIYKTLK